MSFKEGDDTDDCLVGETTGLLDSSAMSRDHQNDAWTSERAHANQRMAEDDSVSIRPYSQSNVFLEGALSV